MTKKSKTKILLTDRALDDIAGIEAYSIAEWGKNTATKYISDIEAALSRLRENPDLLRNQEKLHLALRFYRVNRHFLFCDVQSDTIYVLTVIHASRDIPNYLSELVPTLAQEVELLHRKLKKD